MLYSAFQAFTDYLGPWQQSAGWSSAWLNKTLGYLGSRGFLAGNRYRAC